jgi:hypothetical protein
MIYKAEFIPHPNCQTQEPIHILISERGKP